MFFYAALLALLIWAPPAGAQSGKEVLNEAIDSYNFLDYKDAILKARKAVKLLKNPRDLVSAYTYMGVSYIAQGKVAKGIEAFTHMVQIDPDAYLDPSEFSPKFLKVFERAKRMAGGKVIIVSKISGASVDIDGHFVGKSGPGKPLKVDLVSGKHSLRVYRNDYKTYKGSFKIDGSEVKRITPRLKKKKFGELELVSNVSGGKIYIDGRVVKGKSLSPDKNTILRKILVGKHKVKVSKSNYHTFETEIILSDLKKTIVSIDLRPVNGSLDIFIDKRGTEVFLGERSYGKTASPNDTLALKGLRPGTYKVTGKLKGHTPTEVSVEVEPGSYRKVKLLMKRGTFLFVNTTPPGAVISINGEESGITPLSHPLKPGTIVRVRTSLDGYHAPVMVFTMTGERRLDIRMIKELARSYYDEGRESDGRVEKLILEKRNKKSGSSEQLLYQYIKQSVELYEKAIKEDPEYAMAYSALAATLFRKVEVDSQSLKAGERAASKDIINTILNSQKGISLNNDPLAGALAYRVLGAINLFKGKLEKRVDKKLNWLREAVNSFDKGIRLFKKAEISLDFSSTDLALTYFNRAIAYEYMAPNSSSGEVRGRTLACEAWKIYDYVENHPVGSPSERLISDLRKKADKHRVSFCENHR